MVKRLWQAWLRWEFRNFRTFDWRKLFRVELSKPVPQDDEDVDFYSSLPVDAHLPSAWQQRCDDILHGAPTHSGFDGFVNPSGFQYTGLKAAQDSQQLCGQLLWQAKVTTVDGAVDALWYYMVVPVLPPAQNEREALLNAYAEAEKLVRTEVANRRYTFKGKRIRHMEWPFGIGSQSTDATQIVTDLRLREM